MARPTGKKQVKPATASVHSQVTGSQAQASTSVPEPFIPCPPQLWPLTLTLPKDHVYAVHVDSTPVDLKKRVFVVPIFLNLVIAILLMVRVYYAAPVYLDQIITIFGYETSWRVDPGEMEYSDIMSTITTRTGLLMMDYFIFGIMGSWPKEFLFGSKYSRYVGPWGWRRTVGFQHKDIIVRMGRKWDNTLFSKDDKPWTREQELAIHVKVEPALRRSYTSKTGYLLLDKDWDLDFKAMIDAHNMVEKGRLDIKDLNHIVLVYHQKQWLCWSVINTESTFLPSVDDATISNFRTKLTMIGHEDIFFRWIEIVQYESSKPGGFVNWKKTEAMRELRGLLSGRGVNFDKFWQEIGGEQGIPGLGKAS